MHVLTNLEIILQYNFNDQNLLEQAITHTSQGGTEFQRLEFLGDRVLNLTLTLLLLQQENIKTEGQLAQAIATLGSKEMLYKIGIIWDLGVYLKCNHKQKQAILPDACEAIIGAIFIDSQQDLKLLQQFIGRFWTEHLYQLDYKDAKSSLQEFTYKHYKATPTYITTLQSGEAHNPVFHSIVSIADIQTDGQGTSIKDAEKLAAKKLLDMLTKE